MGIPRWPSTPRSTLVEQSVPSSHVIVDEFASVSNILFTATGRTGRTGWVVDGLEEPRYAKMSNGCFFCLEHDGKASAINQICKLNQFWFIILGPVKFVKMTSWGLYHHDITFLDTPSMVIDVDGKLTWDDDSYDSSFRGPWAPWSPIKLPWQILDPQNWMVGWCSHQMTVLLFVQ